MTQTRRAVERGGVIDGAETSESGDGYADLDAGYLRGELLGTNDDEHSGSNEGKGAAAEVEPVLVVRRCKVGTMLDLSFRTVPRRLVFVDCDLAGLDLEGCDILGLELHRCTAPSVRLDRARVTGDVRLVGLAFGPPVLTPATVASPVEPHGDRGVAAELPGQGEPTAQTDGHGSRQRDEGLWCRVTSTGAAIAGDLDLRGSWLSGSDEDSLAAAAERGAVRNDSEVTPFAVNWELVAQAVGLVAALSAWVAVVGGARLWARMEAANAPALPTLAGLGQDWMVAEGLQTLLVPMLLGLVVALLVYFSRWERRLSDPRVIELVLERRRAWRTDVPARRGAVPWPGFERLRPLLALRRLLESAGGASRYVLAAIVMSLLAAGLLIAQASGRVLFTTILIVVSAPPLALLASTARALWQEGHGKERATRRKVSPITKRYPRLVEAIHRWADAARVPLADPARGRAVVAMAGGVVVLAVFVAAAYMWNVPSDGLPDMSALGAGLVVLALTLLVAAGCWLAARREPALLLVVLLIVSGSGLLLSLAVAVEVPWLLFMGAVTAVSVWVTLGAFVDKTPRSAAVTVFVAVVVWSGALGYVREIGDRTPDLPLAAVTLLEGDPAVESGYLLGRSPSHVFLAQDPPQPEGEILPGSDVERHVVTIPEGSVERLVYGGESVLPEVEEPDGSGLWHGLLSRIPSSADEVPDPHDVPSTRATQGDPPGDRGGVRDRSSPVPPRDELFKAEEPIAHDDRFVSEAPARLEVYPLQRSGDIVYLQVRLENLDSRARGAAELLELAGSDFDTPRLFDSGTEVVHQVSRSSGDCDCSEDLQAARIPAGQSRWLWAAFVVREPSAKVDVKISPFRSITGVEVP